jgi:hypothetical protein
VYVLIARLEQLLDETSLTRIIRELEKLCFSKAEALEANWTNYQTAIRWRRCATLLNDCSAKVVDVDPTYPEAR